LLQACSDADESLDVICQYAARLLPMDSGGLYLFRESRNQIELSVNWGAESKSEVIFSQEDCWAIRRGEMHILDHADHSLACRHLHDWAGVSSLCVPIVAQGNVLGILHLENHAGKEITEAERSLANNLANQIALAMASIKLRDTLRNLSVRDPLTGLFNRRYMEESLQREIGTAQRKSRPLALVILDLDHFKNFNDTFGHEAGDMLLREVGTLLARKSRVGDIACRFGGEEFVVIYPEAQPEIVIQLANQLREAIFALQLQHFGRSLGQISASFGLAFFPTHGSTTDELLRAADKALYEAKAAGRNRIEVAKSNEVAQPIEVPRL
jgi:diguanylate cyclase (GGDEF)-like protein